MAEQSQQHRTYSHTNTRNHTEQNVCNKRCILGHPPPPPPPRGSKNPHCSLMVVFDVTQLCMQGKQGLSRGAELGIPRCHVPVGASSLGRLESAVGQGEGTHTSAHLRSCYLLALVGDEILEKKLVVVEPVRW